MDADRLPFDREVSRLLSSEYDFFSASDGDGSRLNSANFSLSVLSLRNSSSLHFDLYRKVSRENYLLGKMSNEVHNERLPDTS